MLVLRSARAALLAALVLVMLGFGAWGALALHYLGWGAPPFRAAAAVAFAILATVCAILVVWRRTRWWAVAIFAVAALIVLARWFSIMPALDRPWQPDVAVLPTAAIDGDRVTIRNVRNFAYHRDADDVTPRYEERSYDLRQLDEVDLIAVYWGSDAIAHTMVSFGFGDDHVVFSIETRKEQGEPYSPIAGFFKQYELIYIVADERDIIGVRTNFREPREDVYLYRTRISPENGRLLFLDYVREINELAARPQFYNTLTTNCTTDVLVHARAVDAAIPRSWKVLVSGYFPEFVYERGGLDRSMPFPELRQRSYVNPKAQAAIDDPAFSARIRDGLPMPRPTGG